MALPWGIKWPSTVPFQYVGKKVWVKVSNNIAHIYYNEALIKEHLVLTKGCRKTDLLDFPENLAAAVDKGLPRHLQIEAGKIGPQLQSLVKSVLNPHAFLNLRRAHKASSPLRRATQPSSLSR